MGNLSHQLAELRAEFGALREQWARRRATKGDAAEPEFPPDDADDPALAEATREFAADVRGFVVEHPIASAAAALFAGFLLGRLLRRG